MSDTFNPFLEESKDEPSSNPFDDPGDEFFISNEINSKPTIQVEESAPNNSLSKYTSLEQQHQVTPIMRSMSVEEDEKETAVLSDDVDLIVSVEKPEKHVEGYVSYAVTTQTTREQFENREYQVRRRYQDFLWLRQKLEDLYPTHIIPPLPEKFTFSKHMKDKFDSDFLCTRQKALHKFMNRIVQHPIMSFSDNLQTFLTAKAWEMSTARKKEPGPASRVGGTMRNTAAQLMMKKRDDEFLEIAKYNIQFQGKMKTFANIAENIAQERFYLMDDLSEYGSTFQLWANSESRLTETLDAVSKSLEKNKRSLKSLLRVHESRICEPLREYILYCEAVKSSMRRRDQFQLEHELSTEELHKRKTEKEELDTTGNAKSIQTFFGKDPEKVKEEKTVRLTQQIQELTTESEVLADKHEKADHDFKADIERWKKNKECDLKSLLLDIADRHIKFYEANVSAWQEACDSINSPRKAHNQ